MAASPSGTSSSDASATTRPSAPPDASPTPQPAAVSATWVATGSLVQARGQHTATLLINDKVLVVGGLDPDPPNPIPTTAELYDPATRSWTASGANIEPRLHHTATLLDDGRVLVVGGVCSGCGEFGHLASAELYDPRIGTWVATGSMATEREGHTATLLPNGMVLVAGGFGPVLEANGYRMTSLASAELYDPRTGTWAPTGSMVTAHLQHTATLLPDGIVLVAGGICSGCEGTTDDPQPSAELYDPSSGSWSATGEMIEPRGEVLHPATLLSDGTVLVAAGYTGIGGNSAIAFAELFDPSSGAWTSTGTLIQARTSHTATLMGDGTVLVAGGFGGGSRLASAELYDPRRGTWTATAGMIDARESHTATLLADGTVLVAGGYGSDAASAEVYDPGG